jgi:hypothetical protein
MDFLILPNIGRITEYKINHIWSSKWIQTTGYYYVQ